MKVHSTEIARVGVDLAKSVFQVHAVDADGAVVTARQLRRSAFLPWCEELPKGCEVAMESCCAAHFWARRLQELGLRPRLIAPSFVTPYRMGGKSRKNDANDAAAVCEAATRPHMRFVPVKTPTQQGWLALHALREGFIKDRVACMNRTRGILAEFGIIFSLSTRRFRSQLLKVLDEPQSDLTPFARTLLRKSFRHFEELEKHIAWCDTQIRRHVASDENARLAMDVMGVGVLGASALAAAVGDLRQFKNGRQFGSWLGLVPRMHSTGGVAKLGSITKRGDGYLRRILVLGARAAMIAAPCRDDSVSRWVVQLRARVGGPKATIALANKNARILWATLANGRVDSAHPQS